MNVIQRLLTMMLLMVGFLLVPNAIPEVAAAKDLPGYSGGGSGGSVRIHSIALTDRQAAGVYTFGTAFPIASMDFNRGSAFSGVLYACDTNDPDTDNDNDLADESGCQTLATLTANTSSGAMRARKLVYALDINTAETAGNTSRLTIKGSFDEVASADLVDADGDGFYEYVRLPFDADGDGTTWKTCECGTATAPAKDAQWLCGSHAGVSYTAGDAAANPAQCKFDGQRIWDDIGDDFVAVESQMTEGTHVEFEAGTYVIQGTDIDDQTKCWNSTAGDFTDDCPLEESIALANVMARHSGMRLSGQGVDANGFQDWQFTGTHFTKDKGTRAAWRTAGNSDTALDNGQLCVGFPRSGAHGQCGPSLTDQVGSADIISHVRKGGCWDANMDGDCDYDPAASMSQDEDRTNGVEVQEPEKFCVKNTSSWVTSNMAVGSEHFLSQQNRGGGIGRVMYRVEAIAGSAGTGVCDSDATGIEVTMGGVPATHDLSAITWGFPQAAFAEIWGTDGAQQDGNEPHATISAKVNPAKWTSDIIVEQLWMSHQAWRGTGGCTGAEAACDEGTLITVGSGVNHTLRHIGVIHANTAHGSGGAVNGEPYAINLEVSRSVFRFGTGAGLIDISNSWRFVNNHVADNITIDGTNYAGTAQPDRYLIRNQGVYYLIADNLFERNFNTGAGFRGGVVEAISDYGVIRNNKFLTTAATCVVVEEGVRHLDITGNSFDCGDFVPETGTYNNENIGFAIVLKAGNQSEFVSVDANRFIGGGKATNNLDTASVRFQFYILVGSSSANTSNGQIGLGGFSITNNVAQMARAPDSALVAFRSNEDPDNARVWIDGNRITQGGVATGVAFAAGTTPVVIDSNDDGVGLPKCGVNWVGGTDGKYSAYTSFAWDKGSREWPTQCISDSTMLPTLPWATMAAGDAPDCSSVNTPHGSIVTIVDDTTANGTCAQSSGDLTGGSTFLSTCKCQADGNWAAL